MMGVVTLLFVSLTKRHLSFFYATVESAMADSILLYLLLIWNAAPWILLLTVGLGEISAIATFRKRNGSVIWRPARTTITSVIGPALPLSVYLALAIGLRREMSFFLGLVLGIPTIAYVAWLLRILFHGIYRNRAIGEQFVSEWQVIEKVIVLPDRVRLVDAERGAMDFLVESERTEEIVDAVSELMTVDPEDRRSWLTSEVST